MNPHGNRARLAGVLVAVAAALALVALPGVASAHHGHDSLADAGTIESFDQETGVLTIALTEGGAISGLVTPDTHIHCDNGWHRGMHGLRHHLRHGRATASHDGSEGEEGDRHDEPGSDDDHGEGVEPGGDDEAGDDDAAGHDGAPPGHSEGPGRGFEHSDRCTTENLTPGTTVKFAVLTLVDGKAVFAVVGLPQPEGEEEDEAAAAPSA